jgi:ACS family hexuronate transporter-like MFS transporter
MPRERAVRWRLAALMALLFAVSVVGYADRQILALLKPVLDQTLGWRSGDYSAMTTAFQACVAVTLLVAGWFVDKVGVRWGFATGLGGWSAAAMLHAACRSVGQFIVARAALGGFEAIGGPAGIKAVAVLFRPATAR